MSLGVHNPHPSTLHVPSTTHITHTSPQANGLSTITLNTSAQEVKIRAGLLHDKMSWGNLSVSPCTPIRIFISSLTALPIQRRSKEACDELVERLKQKHSSLPAWGRLHASDIEFARESLYRKHTDLQLYSPTDRKHLAEWLLYQRYNRCKRPEVQANNGGSGNMGIRGLSAPRDGVAGNWEEKVDANGQVIQYYKVQGPNERDPWYRATFFREYLDPRTGCPYYVDGRNLSTSWERPGEYANYNIEEDGN